MEVSAEGVSAVVLLLMATLESVKAVARYRGELGALVLLLVEVMDLNTQEDLLQIFTGAVEEAGAITEVAQGVFLIPTKVVVAEALVT